jgi:hypothetical protein
MLLIFNKILSTQLYSREIAGCCDGVDEVFILLGCCAAYVGSCLPIFWDSLSVPFSRVKQSNVSLKILLVHMRTRWHYD